MGILNSLLDIFANLKLISLSVSFQLYGKQRKISETTEFKQLTKQDAKNELAKELEKILNTAPSTVEKQVSYLQQE